MQKTSWSELLWGPKAKLSYLMLATVILLFCMLGGREIWTQEHRWADIVSGMFYRHDFLHPYLGNITYYDKPLLSYWLIALTSLMTGKLSLLAMRLPSAFAGWLAVWSIYRIGTYLKDQRLGLLAGWLLLTTFYFIFWARTSSADMLNLAGSLFAVSWYFEHKNRPTLLSYTLFFMILAVTALCKGLVGPSVAVLAIFPDLMMQNEWKKHLHWKLLLSLIPAAILYVLPFWASTHFGGSSYEQNGLSLVYRENVMRYFQPFDHKGPFYTYFLFLPIYLLPWAIFFIPALFSISSRWKNLSAHSKWMILATLFLFLFFTLSGSRRSYYVLPIVPFAILMTSDWILSVSNKLSLWVGKGIIFSLVIFFLNFDVLQPLYYAQGGVQTFARELHTAADQIKPWSQWQFVVLDAESKASFYLQLPPTIKAYNVIGKRENQTATSLLQAWPFLQNPSVNNTIFITRARYVALLQNYFNDYDIVAAPQSLGERVFHIHNPNAAVAFIPKKKEIL